MSCTAALTQSAWRSSSVPGKGYRRPDSHQALPKSAHARAHTPRGLSLSSGSFPVRQFFTSGGQSIGVSALTSVLPMNIQDRCPLGWTGCISLQSKGLKSLLQHHSSKASNLQHSAFLIVQLSHPYMTTGRTIALARWTFACFFQPSVSHDVLCI